MSLMGWGADTEEEDREFFDPDPQRHDAVGWDAAEADWSRTLAALDGVAGDSIYRRADLDEWAFFDDWEEEP